jgi:hypothetical protein
MAGLGWVSEVNETGAEVGLVRLWLQQACNEKNSIFATRGQYYDFANIFRRKNWRKFWRFWLQMQVFTLAQKIFIDLPLKKVFNFSTKKGQNRQKLKQQPQIN